MKAYVLMHIHPGSVPEVLTVLKDIPGVVEANMTFGPYDVVAVIEVGNFNALGPMVAGRIQPIAGITDTLTCLVVDPAS